MYVTTIHSTVVQIVVIIILSFVCNTIIYNYDDYNYYCHAFYMIVVPIQQQHQYLHNYRRHYSKSHHLLLLNNSKQQQQDEKIVSINNDVVETTTLSSFSDRNVILQQEQQHMLMRLQFNQQIIQNYTLYDLFQPPISILQNHHIQTIFGYILRRSSQLLTSLFHNNNRNDDFMKYNFAYISKDKSWFSILLRIIESLIVSSSLSSSSSSSSLSSIYWDERIRIDTPDHDFFHVDIKYNNNNNNKNGMNHYNNNNNNPTKKNKKKKKAIVLILHGLQSNSYSPICIEIATSILYHHQQKQKQQQQLVDHDDDNDNINDCEVHCINFRGCSGVPNDTIGGYHLGYTNDVIYYMQYLYQQYQQQKETEKYNNNNNNNNGIDMEIDVDDDIDYPSIYLTGFSLGANVVLKCLGELGTMAHSVPYNICGASVLCVPFDQTKNAPILAQNGINRWIYTNNLLRSLKIKCTKQYERFYMNNTTTNPIPTFNYTKVMESKTITEFDDAFIAPIYNYSNCWDYYEQTSCINYISNITIPTLIINACDDPFFNNTIWPIQYSCENNHNGTVPLKMIQTTNGGHLGYCFHQIDYNNQHDERLLFYNNIKKIYNMNKMIIPSWSSWETGRFLTYVHDTIHSQL